jgi:hypothetical protein
MGSGFGALGMGSLSNLNQLGFFAEARVIHEDVDLVTAINQKNCIFVLKSTTT